ncbi:MAG: ribbon-helix-helix protein, CopG family [Vicinamibacteria bacterium]
MRTITLKLPDALAARVSAAARRRGVSASAMVRGALEDRLGSENRGRPGTCLDLAGDLAGVVEGPADLSSNRRRHGRKSIPTRLPPRTRAGRSARS